MRVSRQAWKYLLIPLIVAALLFTACGKTETVDTTKAPDIPPASTFQMSFDDFDQMKQAANAAYSPKGEVPIVQLASLATSTRSSTTASVDASPAGLLDYTNVGVAVLAVGYWSGVLVWNLAIPWASFVESFNHEAVQQSDGPWIWTYTVAVGLDTYTAKLKAEYVGDETHWNMYVSKAGSYTDFNWYSGVSNLPLTHGTWTLKKSQADPTDFIGIEWNRNTTKGTWDIQYTYIVPNAAENGSYIKYGATTDQTYDRFYNLYGKVEDTLTQIQWNHTTKAGRIKSGNGDWRYWDSTLKNTTAP